MNETIVVTGVGMISAVGLTAEAGWVNICAGQSGLGPLTGIPPRGLTTGRAGQIRSIPDDSGPVDRTLVIGLIALEAAIRNAGLEHAPPYDRGRFGLCLGTSLGGARSGERFHREWIANGLAAADARHLRQYPLHATADYLAGKCALLGPRAVHSNACAAGAVAIINGAEYLRTNAADVVLAGGVDPLAYFSFGGFSCLDALSQADCAPYTKSDGLTLGEGAGFLVLERRDAALERGACILAEVAGYGLSADAHHATTPDPRGRGALAAMSGALSMADASAEDVDYINGHGTGTPANDGGEGRMIKGFASRLIPMSSTKSMIGHTLGAAGAVEAVVTVLAIRDQMLPPTVVPDDYDGTPGFDIVAGTAREARIDLALSNSFAFGGNNATIAFRRPGAVAASASRGTAGIGVGRDVHISDYAVVVGTAGDEDAAADQLFAGTRTYGATDVTIDGFGPFPVGEIPETLQTQGINPAYLRRLDPLSKRSASVVARLLKRRGLSRQSLSETGLVFATASGPIETVESFQRGLISEGSGSARLFPNTVMHAAAGHVALLFGLKGPTATYCSGATGGVSALHFGQQLVASGSCDRVVVLAADEATVALLAGYATVPGYLSHDVVRPFAESGRVFGGAAVALLLEADGVLGDVAPLARVVGCGFAGDVSGCALLSHDSSALQRAITGAFHRSGLPVSSADVVVSGATGRRQFDDLERSALEEVGLGTVPVSAPKAVFGDTQACASLLATAQAIWMRKRGCIPQSHHFRGVGPTCVEVNHDHRLRALVTCSEAGGNFQTLLIEA